MLRYFFLSCIAVCLAIGDAAPADGEEILPVADGTEERGSYVASDGRYFVYHIEFNWFQALSFCFHEDMQLATFNNQSDFDRLVSLLRDKAGNADQDVSYWTSGSDLAVRNRYKWLSNGNDVKYKLWFDGQPSHSRIDNEDERCIELSAKYYFKMNDNRCSSPLYFVCEARPDCVVRKT